MYNSQYIYSSSLLYELICHHDLLYYGMALSIFKAKSAVNVKPKSPRLGVPQASVAPMRSGEGGRREEAKSSGGPNPSSKMKERVSSDRISGINSDQH